MRTVRASLLAGVAIIALAGFSSWAHAQGSENPRVHVMTVRLPGGGVEEIRYSGDTPPQIRVGPVSEAVAIPSLFEMSPFAAFDQISAAMDRQAAALLRQAAAFAPPSPNLFDAGTLAQLPAGGREYSFVSTLSGSGVCTRSIQVTATGNGPPKVVTHSAGDCAPVGGAAATVKLPAAQPPPNHSDLIMTKAQGAKPYAGLVHRIAVAQR